jgi:hypothetical protein
MITELTKVVCSPAKPLKSNRMTRNLLRLAESCGAVDLVDGIFAHASGCEIITGGAVR